MTMTRAVMMLTPRTFRIAQKPLFEPSPAGSTTSAVERSSGSSWAFIVAFYRSGRDNDQLGRGETTAGLVGERREKVPIDIERYKQPTLFGLVRQAAARVGKVNERSAARRVDRIVGGTGTCERN